MHRSTVPQRFVVELEGFAREYDDITHEVVLTADAGPAPAPDPPPAAAPVPTEVRATLPLPEEDVSAQTLPDGTRVWVARSDDDRVRVLAGDEVLRSGDLVGARTPVAWVPSERRFRGQQWYDASGVSYAGRAARNLDWYESAVVGDDVEVGRRLGPAPGAGPEVGVQEPTAAESVWHDDPSTVDGTPVAEALASTDRGVVVISEDLVSWRGRPLQLCDAPQPLEPEDWDGCPPEAPGVEGLQDAEARPGFYSVHEGPHRVRIDGDRIVELTLLPNGYASGVIDP